MDKKENNTLKGFVGFIPKQLKLENHSELAGLPLNVMIGRYAVRDNKNVLGFVLYEPKFASLCFNGKEDMSLDYHSLYDSRYRLKITIEKNDIKCEKYCEQKNIGIAFGVIGQDIDKNWNTFFQHVALLGLDNGEKCMFSET